MSDLREKLEKIKAKIKRRRAGNVVAVSPRTDKEKADMKTQKDMESKLRADKTFRDAALRSNKTVVDKRKAKAKLTAQQNRGYDEAVEDETRGVPETVGTKKRSDKYINQMNRRKAAGDKKLITKQTKLKRSIKERWEELKKAMKNGGIGGPGSVKAGAVLPSISKLSKPGNNSLATSINIPSVKQPSKKDPIKSAEQTQNKDIKDLKMKEAQAALKTPEMVKFEKNGQWSLTKSGYKGYSDADNARRKMKNLGEETDVKSMPRIKEYGTSANVQATEQARQAKAASAKNEVSWTHKHPETGEMTTVKMSPRKLKNYQKKMKALADEKDKS